MTKQQVNLTFYTPSWSWCEVRNPGRNTKTGERCKFCQEIKKRGDATRYHCLIYGGDLSVTDGSVRKCRACMCGGIVGTELIEPAPPQPTGKSSEVFKAIRTTLRELKKEFNKLTKLGYPGYIAIEIAIDNILQTWGQSKVVDNGEFDYFLE